MYSIPGAYITIIQNPQTFLQYEEPAKAKCIVDTHTVDAYSLVVMLWLSEETKTLATPAAVRTYYLIELLL